MKINLNTDYKVVRQVTYPSIQEQLDILYHEGYTGWKEKIKAIKDSIPKENNASH